jgi:hypothetical protein
MMKASDLQPGRYRHYRGGDYTVLFVAEHHETREPQVVYVCHKTGGLNVRPLNGTSEDPDGWSGKVNLNKEHTDLAPLWVPRFTYVGPG